MRRLALLSPLLLLGAAPEGAPPRLGLPIACRLGQDCAIQNYPDDDPGPAARDYQCRGRTYQAHSGTDFRLPSMAQARGVAVLASAAGTVRAVRDGEPDVSVRQRGKAAIAGKECGNGVVLTHPGGWETQYCHMARGSIAVRAGEMVAAGAPLGKVGLSGDTEFPHVHLDVRKGAQRIDPFAWGASAGQCGGGRSLWAATPAYRRGEVLVAGFATAPVTMDRVQELGAAQNPRPGRDTSLVAFVQAIGLEGGDVQRLTLRAPDGAVLARNEAAPLDRDKAQFILFAGRKPPAGGWAKGEYRADYEVLRGGREVIAHTERIAL